MAQYRFYNLIGNKIVRGQDEECADDAAAHSTAAAILLLANPRACEAVEIWQLSRYVGRVTRAGISL